MKQLMSAFATAVLFLWATAVTAQSVWIQIEAHPRLGIAQERASDFAGVIPDVNGFQLNSGWYVVALGPYQEADAIDRLRTLRGQGLIAADSFLVDSSVYQGQFWPIGASTLNAPAVPPVVDTGADTGVTVAATPVEPAAPPEETRREALRSEGQLSRQEKFNLQIALQWFGFYDGRIDASFGRGTRSSMADWQNSKGYEPTGVLTTRQRAELTGEYESVLASLGLEPRLDEVAGIEMEMPLAMVEFDRYEPPFAHYTAINDSGVTVLLISQMGDEATLLGLYDIMQTLEIVPLEGERERRSNRFTLTGEDDRISSYTHAEMKDGAVKGFTLIWPAGDDRRREVALKAMRDSFRSIDGVVLPDAFGAGTLDQSIDLISGLQIRRPVKSRSGFYIDSRGTVLSTAEAVEGCGRITFDETYEAQVIASDAELGLALLRPTETLAPMDYARFQAAIPRLQSEVAVSGYSFEGMLSAPTLTFGTLADTKGLRGEETVKRLALVAGTGDAGGPVFDSSGSVLGMLLPPEDLSGKRLPEDVSFATDAEAIAIFLSNSGYSPAASERSASMSAEDLTRLAADLTVLVSCWE